MTAEIPISIRKLKDTEIYSYQPIGLLIFFEIGGEYVVITHGELTVNISLKKK